jgi:hypothetical protein
MTTPAELTIAEAAEWLDPPITRETLTALIGALHIRPAGRRRPAGPGRPAYTYPAAELQALHAAVTPWLPSATPSTTTPGTRDDIS